MTRPLPALLIHQHQLGVARHDDVHTFGVLDDVAVVDPDVGIGRGFEARLLRTTLGRTADVEGPHRELGARLTDRLGRDNADRLTDVHRRAAREVAAVAVAADTDLGVAGQHGADAHRVDPRPLDRVDQRLVDDGGRLADNLPAQRIEDVVGGRPAQDTLAQRLQTSPPSTTAFTVRPRSVLQSISVMMQSCETSTRRRVR